MANVQMVTDGSPAASREGERGSTHFVSEGRVWCPSRGDIDAEVCFACPRLTGLRKTDGHDVIVCNPHADWLDLDPEMGLVPAVV